MNAVIKCVRWDMLASLLSATDLPLLLQNSFVISPSSENMQKDKAATVKDLFF